MQINCEAMVWEQVFVMARVDGTATPRRSGSRSGFTITSGEIVARGSERVSPNRSAADADNGTAVAAATRSEDAKSVVLRRMDPPVDASPARMPSALPSEHCMTQRVDPVHDQ
jgi:hypothetical protein